MNRLKTKPRNQLTLERLDQLMRIRNEAPIKNKKKSRASKRERFCEDHRHEQSRQTISEAIAEAIRTFIFANSL